MSSNAKLVSGLVIIAVLLAGAWYAEGRGQRDAVTSPLVIRQPAVVEAAPTTKPAEPAAPVVPASVPRTSLPPPGQSFAQTERELGDRARAGDIEAAKRLFNDGVVCYFARGDEETLKNSLEQGSLDPDKELSTAPASSLEPDEKYLARLQAELAKAKKMGNLCNGTGPEILDGRMYWYIEQAAKAGDAHAAACFVSGGFIPPTFDSDALVRDDFTKNLLPIAEDQLRRGNVAIVTMLVRYYDGSEGIMSSVRPGTDRAKAYMYSQLNTLISSDETASRVRDEAQRASSGLTPQQIADAQAEANRLFESYFGSKQPIPNPDDVCTFS